MADMKQPSWESKHDKNSKRRKENKTRRGKQDRKHAKKDERETDKWLLEWKKEIREELQLKHNRSN